MHSQETDSGIPFRKRFVAECCRINRIWNPWQGAGRGMELPSVLRQVEASKPLDAVSLGCSQETEEGATLSVEAFLGCRYVQESNFAGPWQPGERRASILKRYVGHAIHHPSLFLIILGPRTGQLAFWEKWLYAYIRYVQRLPVVNPSCLNYNVQAGEGMPCLRFLE
jgi:hypothetical protein